LVTVAVVVLAIGVGFGARAFSRRGRLFWVAGYVSSLVLALAVGVVRWQYGLTFVPPFSWLAAGRREFVVMAVAVAMLAGTLLPRLRQKRLQVFVLLVSALGVIYFAVGPFLGPALARSKLAGLPTRLDRDGVCLQSTSHTCGPAAAVSALSRLGMAAQESELALLSKCAPVYGTSPDLLSRAIEERYAVDGIKSEFRPMAQVADLAGPDPVIVVTEFSAFEDHYVTVVGATDAEITVADPAGGLRTLKHAEFLDVWRNCGIVLRRASD
jgi:predicted double-glycine peptidase